MANKYIKKPLPSLAYTSVLCVAIAVLTWMVSSEDPFWVNLVISLCIGWGVCLSFIGLGAPLERYLHPYVAPIPIIAVGLSAGLIFGGAFTTGDPWYLFSESYFTIAFGVFFGVLGFIVFSTQERLLQARAELAEAAAEVERQEKLNTQIELRLLQAQIEPHFLFNTLSNIASLIHKNPNEAETTLINLTTLLRSSLQRTRQAEITLREELEIVRALLDIHQIRMKERLRYKINCDPQYDGLPLPPLLVQPLVENAIKHGIDPLEEGGCVCIDVNVDEARLCISVTDDGRGVLAKSSNGTKTGTGTGLANVRQRLSSLYGDAAVLTIADTIPHGVNAMLSVPLARAEVE